MGSCSALLDLGEKSGFGEEWNGMEWNGMEWSGMEWNGMEWNGMEWNGMEWNGMEWNGIPRAAVAAPSLEVSKARLDGVWSSLGWWKCGFGWAGRFGGLEAGEKEKEKKKKKKQQRVPGERSRGFADAPRRPPRLVTFFFWVFFPGDATPPEDTGDIGFC
ncbi:hypothetical protein HGM15179_016049 [Zosterops borbonicus]|uniref:Uncharacterized protein n=1 Tax=Zosterops borbonicus TaxID=364589 RepID=A0A8K1G3K4_9PASS|nr:hypothetical protein HGM15179_016049 [Zosterops borbonicus]